jgi:hypothetical protein
MKKTTQSLIMKLAILQNKRMAINHHKGHLINLNYPTSQVNLLLNKLFIKTPSNLQITNTTQRL